MINNYFKFLMQNNKEIVVEGYCKCAIGKKHDDIDYNSKVEYIYVFYLNTEEKKYEILISQEEEIFDLYETIIFDDPEELINDISNTYDVYETKYYILNNGDYINRIKLKEIKNEDYDLYNLGDYLISYDNSKIGWKLNMYENLNKIGLYTEDAELFRKNVLTILKGAAISGSLEEKIYSKTGQWQEDYKKKSKPDSGGFRPAMRMR